MIQRIQTVHYFIAMLLLAVALGFDLFAFSNSEAAQHITFFGNELTTETSTELTGYRLPAIPFFWLNLALMALLTFTILSYKKLKFQARAGRFTLIALIVAIILIFIDLYLSSKYLSVLQPNVTIGAGLYLFIASILFVLLGNRGVKKDRKLLDSLNRLR